MSLKYIILLSLAVIKGLEFILPYLLNISIESWVRLSINLTVICVIFMDKKIHKIFAFLLINVLILLIFDHIPLSDVMILHGASWASMCFKDEKKFFKLNVFILWIGWFLSTINEIVLVNIDLYHYFGLLFINYVGASMLIFSINVILTKLYDKIHLIKHNSSELPKISDFNLYSALSGTINYIVNTVDNKISSKTLCALLCVVFIAIILLFNGSLPRV